NWRILSDQDRTNVISSAKEAQKTALEEVKRRADDAAATEADAVQHDTDAKNADEQAANPPFDISADNRPEYILNKKNEARAARASAVEARVVEADAKKSQAEAQAVADAAAQRIAHPEVAVTDEEKSQAQSDNDAAISQAEKALRLATEQKKKIALEQTH